jgi:hypothetical protein
VSVTELKAYGWEKPAGSLIWRKPARHLTVVPDTKPTVAPKKRTKSTGKRDYRTATCACGAPMTPKSKRCRGCANAAIASTNRREDGPPPDHVIDAVMGTIARNLMATPAPPLPVHLCDCGCLLRLDEALCPECRDWAERNAAVWSWSA